MLVDFSKVKLPEKYPVIVMVISFFMFWCINGVLMVFGFDQKIYDINLINKMDKELINDNISMPIHTILTRSIDKNGKYRRECFTNILIIQGISNLILFIILILGIINNPGWIMDHFIDLNPKSVLIVSLLLYL